MLQLFLTLIRICLFSGKTQDLPSSRQYLTATIAIAVIVLFIGYSTLPGDRAVHLLSIAHAGAQGVGWMILLKLHHRMDRWYQSATALYGCTCLINLAQLPTIISYAEQVHLESEPQIGMTAVWVTALWLWEIAVVSSIIRETLEVRRSLSFIFAVAFSFAIQFLLIQLFSRAG